ncbi:hypothetical protein BD309DRAFT_124400 [Dichomitus squalens]|nr:hypothetical protein BD309DRAFT_124400 [Dichomitus squalens]
MTVVTVLWQSRRTVRKYTTASGFQGFPLVRTIGNVYVMRETHDPARLPNIGANTKSRSPDSLLCISLLWGFRVCNVT